MNMLRPIFLAVLMFSLVAAGLPVSDSLAHWSQQPHAHGRTGKHLRRRHSRAWWRRRRARLQRRRALALARRRRPAASAGRAGTATNNNIASHAVAASKVSHVVGRSRERSVPAATPRLRTPYDMMLPGSWSGVSASVHGEMKFTVRAADGRATGTAVIAPVATAVPSPQTARRKTLGGVPLTTLGRSVIDRMVAESGWVVNDMVREIEGRRVYIVIAQSGQPGAPTHSWNFYFTEMDGRIYSLATTAPLEFAVPLAVESEQVIASLRVRGDNGANGSVVAIR